MGFIEVYDLDEEGDGGISIKCAPSSMRGCRTGQLNSEASDKVLPQSG